MRDEYVLLNEVYKSEQLKGFLMIARNLTKSTEVAEDIVHDAFENVLKRIADPDKECPTERNSLVALLYTCIKCRASDYRKKASTVNESFPEHLPDQPFFDTGLLQVAGDDNSSVLQRAKIAAKYAKLTAREEEVLFLRLEGYKVHEIAQKLGVVSGEISNRGYRGRKKLERLITDINQ